MPLLDIQDGGRISAALQRFLRLQGRVRPQIDSIIVPTVSVGDLGDCQEPGVCLLSQSQGTSPAVAAEFGAFRLDVPVGIIAVIRKIWIEVPAAAGAVAFRMGAAAVLTLTNPGANITGIVDQRANVPNVLIPGATLTDGTSVATIQSVSTWTQSVLAAGTLILPNRWVIGTGQAAGVLEIQTLSAVNVTMNLALEWEEFAVV